MRLFRRVVGTILDAITGPSETVEVSNDARYTTFQHTPSEMPRALAYLPTAEVVVESRRIVYKTYYQRSWIPNTTHLVFRVQGRCPEWVRDRMNPAFFEAVVYPCLSNWWLRWTEYPHVAAINAFIDRFHHFQDSDLKA